MNERHYKMNVTESGERTYITPVLCSYTAHKDLRWHLINTGTLEQIANINWSYNHGLLLFNEKLIHKNYLVRKWAGVCQKLNFITSLWQKFKLLFSLVIEMGGVKYIQWVDVKFVYSLRVGQTISVDHAVFIDEGGEIDVDDIYLTPSAAQCKVWIEEHMTNNPNKDFSSYKQMLDDVERDSNLFLLFLTELDT